MTKSYKAEIDPVKDQVNKINRSIGVCRFLYNRYIHINKQLYESIKHLGLRYIIKSFWSAYDFDKYVNNILSKQEGYEWILDAPAKARKKAICNAEVAFKKFFSKKSKYPRFKKKSRQDITLYFARSNKGDFKVDRHRIRIPAIGYVRLKEKGYIPKGIIKSCTMSVRGDRYYISVLIDVNIGHTIETSNPIGIDLGIKNLATISDGRVYKNINKTHRVKRIKRKLRREQRRLSRKYNMKKGEGTKNILKQVLKVRKLHAKLSDIRLNHIRQAVNELVKTKPEYIVIEDLNIKGMMKNRCVSRAVSEQGLHTFRTILTQKCIEYGLRLRVVSRFYPSSKKCSHCGHIKKDLKLSDRIYICSECGLIMDRDINASINLVTSEDYTYVT